MSIGHSRLFLARRTQLAHPRSMANYDSFCLLDASEISIEWRDLVRYLGWTATRETMKIRLLFDGECKIGFGRLTVRKGGFRRLSHEPSKTASTDHSTAKDSRPRNARGVYECFQVSLID